jgi:hypothetical protein
MSSRQEFIGERLLALKKLNPDKPLSELVNEADWDALPPDESSSIGMDTAAAYRQELKQRGDRYARQMLRKLDGEEIGDDPSGE